MTFFEPTLIVERMRIEREQTPVYDEAFHEGVNVIRGDNSSGKSTILNFIFYGLGGDLSDWSAAAQRCSRVLIQARVNGNVATLSREIVDRTRQPMDIYPGEIDRALAAPTTEWRRYGYQRSDKRESFSQALFRLMNLPEVANDTSGNLTINQILRLLYADQLSPIESLFKYQGIFDNADLRDAVGRLLFGAHSSQFYENEQEIRRLDKELDQIIGEYRSLLSVVGEGDEVFTHEWIGARRANLQQLASGISLDIERAQRAGAQGDTEGATLKAQEAAYDEVVVLQQQLGGAREERNNLALKIADSDRFILALRHKLASLRDTDLVAEVVGNVRFSECPACQAPMIDDATAHTCYLCKTPYEAGDERGRITAMINDTALQIGQSEELQRARRTQADDLDRQIRLLTDAWRTASERMSQLRRSATTEQQAVLNELNRRAGYVQRELEELARKEELANRLRALSDRRAEIEGQIARLRADNEALERQQSSRIQRAGTAVSDEIKSLLVNDLRRQDIFEDPRSVAFSFRENNISVNEERYFSASSRAILKSSFTLALLAAATKLEFMRHPRICLIDTLENMGVEAIRSQNFQRQILRVSGESSVDHQVIYATAMIAEELDDEKYTVGRNYTRDQPSLELTL